MRAAGRLLRPVRQAASALFPGGLILLYHRVASLATDPQWLSVPPALFAEHLEAVKRSGQVISLSELIAAMARGRVPRRAIVVTFDDGYLDNLQNAKPLLERHGVPATVFVTTGAATRVDESYWDELDRLLLQRTSLPQMLRVMIAGHEQVWELGVSAAAGGWNVSRPPPGPAERAYAELCLLMKPLTDDQRTAVLDQIRAQLGRAPAIRPSHEMMTPNQWSELADGGLVEIGAHTRTHPMLSQLPTGDQEREIRESKSALEERLGQRVRAMAYPFGTRADYSETTVRLTRDAGYDAACSNFSGIVRARTDRYQLPRTLVRDWPADELERRIGQWFRD